MRTEDGPFCIVSPDPERLLPRILASRERLTAGLDLPAETSVDLLDLRTMTLLLGRSPSTRAHTFGVRAEPAPVVGTRRALVLLVDFSDHTAATSQAHYRDMLFSAGTYPTGSLRDFYTEASYGKLSLDGLVSGEAGPTAGWYRAPQPKSYYTNGNFGFGSYPNNSQKLVEDLVQLADPFVDFSSYDNDGDGVVDALVVLAAGTGAEQTGQKDDIWSHAWAVPTPISKDGVKISGYFIGPEDGRVGVMAHELGHSLMHWPDLYDTDYSSAGTGAWDLMAGGSWNGGGDRPAHPTAYCKVKAGWAAPIDVINQHVNVSLQPYSTTPQVYRLPVAGAPKEYFLVTNRQPAGFDDHLPGTGMLIEHVDETRTSNTDDLHYLVDIEQCDGRLDLNKNANRGDAEDPYPCGLQAAFTATTNPNSHNYAGADSAVAVTSITRAGTVINAVLKAGKEEEMNTILGTWDLTVDWGDDGSPVAAAKLTFNADGSWTYPYGGGRWVQVGGFAFWTFTNAAGLVYTGTITHDSISGAMGYASASSTMKGSFYMLRAATPAPAEVGAEQLDVVTAAPRQATGSRLDSVVGIG